MHTKAGVHTRGDHRSIGIWKLARAGSPPTVEELPKAEVHILDGGHFVLDESVNEVAKLMRDFLGRHSQRAPNSAAART